MMKMTAANKLSVGLSLLMIFFNCSYAIGEDNQLIVIPGKISQVVSPNGKWLLLNIDSENEKNASFLGGNHVLYLLQIGNDKVTKIYSYDRHIEILWSPIGNKLLINDFAGSNYSFPIIILLDRDNQIVNVKQDLMRKDDKNQIIADSHHLYIVGTEWLNDNSLKVKVYGYGDMAPEGFTLWYDYDIGSGFKK